MKKLYTFFNRKIRFCILFLLLISSVVSYSQVSGTCTVLQQPCNGDGILYIQTTGMTPPLTIDFAYFNNLTVQSPNTDVTVYNLEYFPHVYVHDAAGHNLYLNTGMVRPFQPDYPVVVPAICPDPGNALITVNNGLNPDYVEWYKFDGNNSYNWNNFTYYGTGNPISLYEGTYRAKVFYGGCYVYNDTLVHITYQTSINYYVNSTGASCTNGTATVVNLTGGVPPYSYLWSNGATTPTITGLSRGTYTVKVTDATGCFKEDYAYVWQTPIIETHHVVTQMPTCLQNDGRVMAFGSGGLGPYTYLWSDGQTTQEAVNLTGGTDLSYIVTDHNGCTGDNSVSLSSSTPINVTYTASPSSCTASTGSATLNITGGTLPYTVTWNTYPSQTGTTVTGLAPGNYSFLVTDNVGCARAGMVHIPPVSIINASGYSIDPVCPSTTGTAGVYVSGASPFTFLWNNGQNTQAISGVSAGTYYCTITDVNGCSVHKTSVVSIQSPISLAFSSTPATCIYAADGSLQVIPMGGTPPYTFQWSNGSTSNPAVNLVPGSYWVNVTDANGCTKTGWGYVQNSGVSTDCFYTIDGYVYYDLDGNCQALPGDSGINHVQIKLDPFGYTFTDSRGYFQFNVPAGDYILSEVVQYIYPMTQNCPANNPLPISVTSVPGHISHNFFNTINPLHDAHIITINDNMPVPGFQYRQKLVISNDGTVGETDVLLNYTPDSQIPLIGTMPLPLLNTGTLWYNQPNSIPLNPGQEEIITNYFNLPPNIPLGTSLLTTDYVSYQPPISNWTDDYTPWNNSYTGESQVVGSYDPNSKDVIPLGIGPEGTITKDDSVLEYIIHFQNMGTYYAENIVVTDTLDPDLDYETLKPGPASHYYTAEITGEGVLKFTFPNIRLDWKDHNEINSNGFVTYSIRQKKNLQVGTQIKNSAAIFFDFNAPVITRTTLNTIGVGTGTFQNTNDQVKISPNPASDRIDVLTNNFIINSYYISDLAGRKVLTSGPVTDKAFQVNIHSLTSGIYLLVLIDSDGNTYTEKFTKL